MQRSGQGFMYRSSLRCRTNGWMHRRYTLRCKLYTQKTSRRNASKWGMCHRMKGNRQDGQISVLRSALSLDTHLLDRTNGRRPSNPPATLASLILRLKSWKPYRLPSKNFCHPAAVILPHSVGLVESKSPLKLSTMPIWSE